MIVLGITDTHCATAAVMRDGRIIGCASEERSSRLKNDAGYPRRAIDALLCDLGLRPADVDAVALAGADAAPREWLNRVLHDDAYARRYYGVQLDRSGRLRRRARKLAAGLGLAARAPGKRPLSSADRLDEVTGHLGVGADRVRTFDHHHCYAAAAYFGAPFSGDSALVLTNDNPAMACAPPRPLAAGPRSTATRPRRARPDLSARSTRSRRCCSA